MVDENLRKEMGDAYADGDYKKALKLSRQLGKQILCSYIGKRKPKEIITLKPDEKAGISDFFLPSINSRRKCI